MANTKISALPAATTVGAADLIPIVQGGVTKQTTHDLLPLSAAQTAALAATYLTQASAPSTVGGGAEFRDRFADHADGALGTATTGQSWTVYANPTGDAPAIVGGKLVPAASGGATYPTVELAHRVVRQGGAFVFQPGATTNPDSGSVAIMPWDGDIAALSTAAGSLQVPPTPVHLDVTRTGWGLSYIPTLNGPVTSVANGSFAAPLANDGTTCHFVEYVLDAAAGKVYLSLPDGSVATVTDSHFTSIPSGRFACWESYQPTSADSRTAFVEVWGDSGPRGDLVLRGRRDAAYTPLAAVSAEYAPGSNVTWTVPGSTAEMDGTHAAVNVYSAAPRDVWIDCEAYINQPSGGQLIWVIFINHSADPYIFGVKGPYEGPVRLRKKYHLPAGLVTVSVGAAPDGTAGTFTMGSLNPLSLQVSPY